MELPHAGPVKPGQAQCRCRFKVSLPAKDRYKMGPASRFPHCHPVR